MPSESLTKKKARLEKLLNGSSVSGEIVEAADAYFQAVDLFLLNSRYTLEQKANTGKTAAQMYDNWFEKCKDSVLDPTILRMYHIMSLRALSFATYSDDEYYKKLAIRLADFEKRHCKDNKNVFTIGRSVNEDILQTWLNALISPKDYGSGLGDLAERLSTLCNDSDTHHYYRLFIKLSEQLLTVSTEKILYDLWSEIKTTKHYKIITRLAVKSEASATSDLTASSASAIDFAASSFGREASSQLTIAAASASSTLAGKKHRRAAAQTNDVRDHDSDAPDEEPIWILEPSPHDPVTDETRRLAQRHVQQQLMENQAAAEKEAAEALADINSAAPATTLTSSVYNAQGPVHERMEANAVPASTPFFNNNATGPAALSDLAEASSKASANITPAEMPAIMPTTTATFPPTLFLNALSPTPGAVLTYWASICLPPFSSVTGLAKGIIFSTPQKCFELPMAWPFIPPPNLPHASSAVTSETWYPALVHLPPPGSAAGYANGFVFANPDIPFALPLSALRESLTTPHAFMQSFGPG